MSIRIIEGDCRTVLAGLPDGSVNCCVTSPPYFGLRDYGVAGQMGLEATPAEFVAGMVGLFRDVRRVLRDDGTLWLNLGDTYQNAKGQAGGVDPKQPARRHGLRPQDVTIPGLKPKDLIGIPWRVAFALQEDGWYLRQDIIWSKPNPMPESVRDRCTKAHEYIFMLSKSRQYFYDNEAIKEPMSLSSVERLSQDVEAQTGSACVPGKTNGTIKAVGKVDKQRGHGRRHAGFNDRWDAMERAEQCTGLRNKRSVWEVATQPFSEAHFATFPPALIEPCIKAGCPTGGTVLDPFGGAGTTGLVADRLQRNAILIELNPAYAEMARKRLTGDAGMFAEVA
ncbi:MULTISPECIES: site-specific DNA-methyltransferase [unclassified Mesorhizobium]|uniref:DNA-methyltransferase n=1 Tax=unclassified Mesorhizobium TaxID=325217 RepID=UPI001FE03FC7|nr:MULTISPECIES: site-specific DNA-methyltransferase [unclassified Mesorhizobium]